MAKKSQTFLSCLSLMGILGLHVLVFSDVQFLLLGAMYSECVPCTVSVAIIPAPDFLFPARFLHLWVPVAGIPAQTR